MIEEEIFRKKIFHIDKLLAFGFQKEDNTYIYKKKIMDDQFEIVLTYSDILTGKIYDLSFEEEYTNFRIENTTSAFVNTIKNEYENLCIEITQSCCSNTNFESDQANRISQLIQEKYHISPEFIFDKFPDLGVFRIQKKWFSIIMPIEEFNGMHQIEVINVKCKPEQLDTLFTMDGIYEAYHMNKKNWISIVLNDTIDDQTIMDCIIQSYHLVTNTSNCHDWIVPANPAYYDIIQAFHNGHMFWKTIKNIHTGDIVYFYVAKPYSAILFKCLVTDENKYDYMMLELLEEYDPSLCTLNVMKTFGVNTVRGPRSIPKDLIEYLKRD